MKFEKSCGAVIYRKKNGKILFLLLKHQEGGHWGLPKGHMETGESEEQTARREIFEETGLVVVLKDSFRESQTYEPRPGVEKEVVYFLAKAKKKKLRLQEDEIFHGVWLELEDAFKLVTHPATGVLLKKAQDFLEKST